MGETHRREHVRRLGFRVLRRQHRRQIAVVDFRFSRGFTRCLVRRRDHGEHRLSDILDETVGEDRIVVHNRPAIVDTWDVRCDEHVDDIGRRTHRAQVDRCEHRVCLGTQSERDMQCAGELGDIVDVGRLTRNVESRGLVRRVCAGDTRGVG